MVENKIWKAKFKCFLNAEWFISFIQIFIEKNYKRSAVQITQFKFNFKKRDLEVNDRVQGHT